ncbi:MAG: GntR family transcriptional regulator [Erysipelotrichia bacterium]|nr:GntR family transcriptional regulator [Erysipelotrichia bacterium]NCC54041.1 GntR family transcriptional regulator [Erysipelotrichia bacterium]
MNDNIKQLFHLDKNSPVPMYFQIKQEIINAIKQGVYQTGDQLPTELEFCNELNISRPTIRQAFQELINEGYITRQKAKGTFVSKPKVEGFFFKKLESYNEEMKQLGLTPSTNVLLSEVEEANDDVAKHLKLKPKDKVFHLIRQRFADGEPMVYVHTYVPYNKFKNIEEEDFSKLKTSLYDLMKNKYHMPIAYVDRTIEAGNASSELCSLLQINDGQAVYTITTISYNSEDEPTEYSIAKYRGDRNKFSIRLVQQ